MGKVLKKAAPIIGTIGGSLIPGVGPIIGPAIGGALGGAVSGGGLKGAALGALGGAAFGAAPAIGAASDLGSVGTAALTKGVQGAALGGIGGGAKGALLGAGLGGLGGFLSAGGAIPGLGSLPGAPLSGGLQGPTQGSGILGKFGSLTGATGAGGAQPMKLGSLLQTGGKLLGYSQGQDSIDDMRRILEEQAMRAEGQFAPYSQAGQVALANLQAPNLEALQNDPGYQFRLQQGNQALERSLAARGLGQSSAALKAAQEYGQGLADQTYNDYFGRQAQLANFGYGSASGLGSIYAGLGNAQAAALRAQMENTNKLYGGLGGLFG
jgi:hypothetical protein